MIIGKMSPTDTTESSALAICRMTVCYLNLYGISHPRVSLKASGFNSLDWENSDVLVFSFLVAFIIPR